KGAAHILREGKVCVPVSAVQMVIENATRATRFVAVGQEEIFIAPFLEAWVILRVMLVTGALVGGVKIHRIRMIVAPLHIKHRREIAAAAEPALRRIDMARIHMHSGYARVLHMGDE